MLNIETHTATSAAGTGVGALRASLLDQVSGLRPNDLAGCKLNTWIGRVKGIEASELPAEYARFESRNNRLAWLALQQDGMLERIQWASDRFGAHRIGIILGTSTSSIARTEEAYRELDTNGQFRPEFRQSDVHNMHSPGLFVAAVTGVLGPSLTVSTACSSSAKVFATADRWIRRGLIDAAVVGGVDSLCLNTLYGFNALQLISSDPCRPFDRRRNGINLGEAAAFALVTRVKSGDEAPFRLLGYGESSDAYHMSHPHPEGRGAILAMEQALHSAGLAPGDVDYINLHGTGTRANDTIETLAVASVLGNAARPVPTLVSSTKGWTGHTLGAAGMLESVITLEAMRLGVAPGTLLCEQRDESLCYPVLGDNEPHTIRIALSNSFGFGGNNATLAFGQTGD